MTKLEMGKAIAEFMRVTPEMQHTNPEVICSDLNFFLRESGIFFYVNEHGFIDVGEDY